MRRWRARPCGGAESPASWKMRCSAKASRVGHSPEGPPAPAGRGPLAMTSYSSERSPVSASAAASRPPPPLLLLPWAVLIGGETRTKPSLLESACTCPLAWRLAAPVVARKVASGAAGWYCERCVARSVKRSAGALAAEETAICSAGNCSVAARGGGPAWPSRAASAPRRSPCTSSSCSCSGKTQSCGAAAAAWLARWCAQPWRAEEALGARTTRQVGGASRSMMTPDASAEPQSSSMASSNMCAWWRIQ
mmetsp:Transcript_19780/g.63476  ORF Transcript_19780/g.63476 Transcript_19780/m.63476 type:complete len:250 (+) Transcript_19780:1314-2063(+)